MFPWGRETCWDGLTWSLAKSEGRIYFCSVFFLAKLSHLVFEMPCSKLGTDHSTSASANQTLKDTIKIHIRKVQKVFKFLRISMHLSVFLNGAWKFSNQQECFGKASGVQVCQPFTANIWMSHVWEISCESQRRVAWMHSGAAGQAHTRGTGTKELFSLLIPFMNALKSEE